MGVRHPIAATSAAKVTTTIHLRAVKFRVLAKVGSTTSA